MKTKKIGFLLPTLGFQIGTEIATKLASMFSPPKYDLYQILGGYLLPENDTSPHYAWIYDIVRELDLQGLILYTGGLGYKLSTSGLTAFCRSFDPTPVVSVGAEIPGIPSIVTDNKSGMYHLVHRVFGTAPRESLLPAAFIGGPPENVEARERLEGWRLGMKDLGLPVQEELIQVGNFTRRSGSLGTDLILSNDAAPIPRMIFCANDLTAIGVMEQLRAANFAVPGDIGVTGFDDFEYAIGVKPGLTTVHNPVREMAEMAGKCLIDLMEGRTPPMLQSVSSYPVIRNSTPGEELIDLDREIAFLAEDILIIRDMMDRRVLIETNLSILQQDKSIFQGTENRLLGAGIRGVWIIRNKTSDTQSDQIRYLTEEALPGLYTNYSDSPLVVPPGSLVPDTIELHPNPKHWLIIHPLGFSNNPLGYMICLTDGRAAMLPELLAVQVTALIQKVGLLEQFKVQSTVIQETKVRLDRAEKISSLGRLVAGLAHEMNTPIGTGITLTSLLYDRIKEIIESKPLLDKEISDFFRESEEIADTLQETFHRLVGMVDDFKTLSSHNSLFQVQTFDLEKTLETYVLGKLEGIPQSCSISFHSQGNLVIQGFPEILEKVIDQLLVNTFQHGYSQDSPGKISISINELSQEIEIIYRDFGRGIEESGFARLFEPFYTTSRSKGNIGLGLHIIHSLITLQLGGSIDIYHPRDKEPGLEAKIRFPKLPRGGGA